MARDKLDKVRGVRQKILTYELFLNKYPQYANKVVLIQMATSTMEQAGLDATASDIVTGVDPAYSTLARQPLMLLRQDVSSSQHLALMTVTECCMITSLRESMNLISHEFVYCQDGKYLDKKFGLLILMYLEMHYQDNNLRHCNDQRPILPARRSALMRRQLPCRPISSSQDILFLYVKTFRQPASYPVHEPTNHTPADSTTDTSFLRSRLASLPPPAPSLPPRPPHCR
jgi:hypothetical protein